MRLIDASQRVSEATDSYDFIYSIHQAHRTAAFRLMVTWIVL
jgi:hypothetical protein